MPGYKRKHSRRGGFLGSLVNSAVVPGTILAMQQTYKKKGKGGKRTRKHRRHSRRRH